MTHPPFRACSSGELRLGRGVPTQDRLHLRIREATDQRRIDDQHLRLDEAVRTRGIWIYRRYDDNKKAADKEVLHLGRWRWESFGPSTTVKRRPTEHRGLRQPVGGSALDMHDGAAERAVGGGVRHDGRVLGGCKAAVILMLWLTTVLALPPHSREVSTTAPIVIKERIWSHCRSRT